MLTLKSPMETARRGHGVACIAKFLFVVGGYGLQSCEQFDQQADEWSPLPEIDDEFTWGISLVVTRKRYLHAFGGCNDYDEYPEKEMVRTLDSLRPQWGWRG